MLLSPGDSVYVLRDRLAAGETVMVQGRPVAGLICYEQLLVWPALVSLAHNPQVIVAPSNAWWSRDTSIPDIQRTALRGAAEPER